MKNNFIFIGMPGSGKSTLGKMLSRKKQLNFLDTDKLIEEKYNLPLQQILNEHGEEYFKQIEEDILCSIDTENTVIATGGSAVYSEKGMNHLASIGTVVFIDIDSTVLPRRIKNPKSRGIVLAKGETISDIYVKRLPLYKKYADITVKSGNESPTKTIEKLIKMIWN